MLAAEEVGLRCAASQPTNLATNDMGSSVYVSTRDHLIAIGAKQPMPPVRLPLLWGRCRHDLHLGDLPAVGGPRDMKLDETSAFLALPAPFNADDHHGDDDDSVLIGALLPRFERDTHLPPSLLRPRPILSGHFEGFFPEFTRFGVVGREEQGLQFADVQFVGGVRKPAENLRNWTAPFRWDAFYLRKVPFYWQPFGPGWLLVSMS